MDEMIYNSLTSYYHALEKTGYLSWGNVQKLLILIFFKDFVYHDYRGLLSKEDYYYIERALDCLYGSTCLIPYPDYLKMNKLYLGNMTEMAQRIKTLEDTNVLKAIHDLNSVDNDVQSDVVITVEE